jgi:hypothetical protein
MKKLLYILPIAFIVLFSSCNKFLNESLLDGYDSENFYTNQTNAVMGVTSVYNSLYGSLLLLWQFGDVASDDAVKGGNPGDQAGINDLNNFSANSDNGQISIFWQNTYETIDRANNAIANIVPMNANAIDTTLRNRLVGECKYLRALSYFNLVNIFGKVPLKLEPQTTPAAINVGLSSVDAIYTQIEKDLTDAIAVLPASYTGTDLGRVTKGAAYGLLAKAYLYQQDYTDCLTNINALENLHQYNLVKNYADLFKHGAEDSCEVIFGLRFVNNVTVALGNSLTVNFAPSVEGGYYFDAPTQSYVNAFTETTIDGKVDPRLDASIGRNGQPWFNNTVFSSSWSPSTGYLVKKYDENLTSGIPIGYSTVPYDYMRYADILLMKAEALNEIGDLADAAIAVNRVRSRADLAPTIASNQTDMRNVIRNERRKELGFESHRFFDLMRWGQATAEAALGGNLKWTDPRFYFPIPQTEVDTNQALSSNK